MIDEMNDREFNILNNIRGPPGPDVVRREGEQERLVHPFLNGVAGRGNRWGTRGLTDSLKLKDAQHVTERDSNKLSTVKKYAI